MVYKVQKKYLQMYKCKKDTSSLYSRWMPVMHKLQTVKRNKLFQLNSPSFGEKQIKILYN